MVWAKAGESGGALVFLTARPCKKSSLAPSWLELIKLPFKCPLNNPGRSGIIAWQLLFPCLWRSAVALAWPGTTPRPNLLSTTVRMMDGFLTNLAPRLRLKAFSRGRARRCGVRDGLIGTNINSTWVFERRLPSASQGDERSLKPGMFGQVHSIQSKRVQTITSPPMDLTIVAVSSSPFRPLSCGYCVR